MQSRVAVFSEAMIEAGWLAAAALIPIVMNTAGAEGFDLAKTSTLQALSIVIAAAWLIQIADRAPTERASLIERLRGAIVTSPITLAATLGFAATLIATCLSIAPEVSIVGYRRSEGAFNTASYAVIFFAIVRFMRRLPQVERLITTILFTTLPVSLYAIAQHFGLEPNAAWVKDTSFRAFSSFGNPIFLGSYLVLVIPLTLARLARSISRPKGERRSGVATYSLLLACQCFALLFTRSRGPWVGLIVGTPAVALFALQRWGRRWQFWTSALVLAAAAAFVIALNVPSSPIASLKGASPYLARLGSIGDNDGRTKSGDARDESGASRKLKIMGDGRGGGIVGLVLAEPFRTVVGYGPETLPLAYSKHYPPTLFDLEPDVVIDRAHDDYLDTAVSSGGIGLVAQLLLLGTFFVTCARSAVRAASVEVRFILLALLAAGLSHAVEQLSGIEVTPTRSCLWLYMGMAVVLSGRLLEWAGETEVRPPPATTMLWAYAVISALLLLALTFTSQADGIEPLLLAGAEFGWLGAGVVLVARTLAEHDGERPAGPLGGGGTPVRVAIAIMAATALAYGPFATIAADDYALHAIHSEATSKDQAFGYYLSALHWNRWRDSYYTRLASMTLRMAQSAPDGPRKRHSSMTRSGLESIHSIDALSREDLLSTTQAVLSEAHELFPLDTEATLNLARYYVSAAISITSDAARQKENFDSAEALFNSVAKQSPNWPPVYNDRGDLYQKEGRVSDARKEFKRAIDLSSHYAEPWWHLGDLDQLAQDWTQAYHDYEASRVLSGSSEAWAGIGVADYKLGALAQARDATMEAIRINPQNLAARGNLASIYKALGEPDNAIAAARTAIEYAPPASRERLNAFIADIEQSRKQ